VDCALPNHIIKASAVFRKYPKNICKLEHF
jgi:hypothetical protein